MTRSQKAGDHPVMKDVPIGIEASEQRQEFDSMGTVEVPADRYWGAQSQRSFAAFFDRRRPYAEAGLSRLWLCEEGGGTGKRQRAAGLINGALMPSSRRPTRWSRARLTRIFRCTSGKPGRAPSRT